MAANLEDAKTAIRAEKVKLTAALSILAGSRWLTALAAALAMSFGVTLAYAPGRLPNLSGLSLTTFGLPDNFDFGAAGQQAREAAEAAQRQGAGEAAAGFLAEHANWIPWLNGLTLALCLALLGANLWTMTKRRRYTRG